MKIIRKIYRKFFDHPKNWLAFSCNEMSDWYKNGENHREVDDDE